MRKEIFEMEEQFIEVLNDLEYGDEMFVSRSREGVFTPAVTMWLMICQKLKGGQSLQRAIEDFVTEKSSKLIAKNKTSKRYKMQDISTNSGGFSQARKRLSSEDVNNITEAIAEKIILESQDELLWEGRRAYVFDGTTIRLEHTKSNLKEYPVSSNQHGKSHTPLMLCGCMHELYSGVALNIQFGAYRGGEATSEQRLYAQMINDVPKGSIVIADRNLGTFSIAYATKKNGSECLVRLTKSRAKSIAKLSFKGEDDIDIKVVLNFGQTRLTELEIPKGAKVGGRFIRRIIKRRGYENLELFFFTTSTEPADKLVELYAQRERIENDIRSLKYVIGMEMLHAKTPDMIKKEVLLGVAAYNLVRIIVAKAALKLKLLPRQISFSSAVNLVRRFGYLLAQSSDKNENKKILERFMVALKQCKLPNRTKRRVEPRKVAHERQGFARLRKSRKEERKMEKLKLKEYGHRGYFTSVTRDY